MPHANNKGACVAIDFETSGKLCHYACAIGLAKIENNEITHTYYSLIRPPSSDVWFTHIHGLTWKMLRDAPTFRDIWGDVAQFISGARFLVAHNARFDRRVLNGCCEAFACPNPGLPFLDTLKGARQAIKMDSHSLDSVCDYFGIDLDHHNAASDASGCARIYLKLLKCGQTAESMLL